mmetsp:Transcript_22597/g.33077  ORF Transcript_22597/g.33077 Transcript_22597/m.33077 type:complete len:80 (-) Transcript_22597:101-340(-)
MPFPISLVTMSQSSRLLQKVASTSQPIQILGWLAKCNPQKRRFEQSQQNLKVECDDCIYLSQSLLRVTSNKGIIKIRMP